MRLWWNPNGDPSNQWIESHEDPNERVVLCAVDTFPNVLRWYFDNDTDTSNGFDAFVASSSIRPPSGATDDGWALVFRQSGGGLFQQDEWIKNADDPTAPLFSILGDLESFRLADGAFEFRLEYPELDAPNTQHWRQTSNPVTRTEGNVTGYEAIDVPFSWGFRGLEYSAHNWDESALLDGCSWDDGRWWYAIGTHEHFTKDGEEGIPGPGTSDDGGQVVQHVELWVKMGT